MKFTSILIISFLLPSFSSFANSLSTDNNILKLNRDKLRIGQKLMIKNLDFKEDTSIITLDSHEVLDELSEFLNSNPDIKIQLGGHTNSIPPVAYCQKLSTQRAEAVANYLMDKGIKASRLSYHGYGKTLPIATNTTPEGRKKNQRVEIKIIHMD